MVTVMRASGCRAGDVASHPATETCIGLDSPQQSLLPSTSTSHLFLFHKTSGEDDTSERASISLPLRLSCTKKSRGERRRRRRDRLLTYSDGVSSPHQSRMAANPLLCFYRKKEERDGGRRRRRGSQKDVTECICIQG